jgi:hypothetical protein
VNPTQELQACGLPSKSVDTGNSWVGLSAVEETERGNGENVSLLSGYNNWSAIAGFFDGDGGLDVEVRSYTLHWVLNFVDNWPPQLFQIKQFMESEGIKVGALRRSGRGGYKIEVAAIDSLQRCALAMLEGRNLFKKKQELELMLDYFSGRKTGDEVVRVLNEEVTAGIRIGKVRGSGVPYTYFEGKRIYKKGHVWNSLSQSALKPFEKETVRKRYAKEGMTIYQLASIYRVSPSTIFRTVRDLRRGTGG